MSKFELISDSKYRICLAGSKTAKMNKTYKLLCERFNKHEIVWITDFDSLKVDLANINILITNLVFSDEVGISLLEEIKEYNVSLQTIIIYDTNCKLSPARIFTYSVNAVIQENDESLNWSKYLSQAIILLNSKIRIKESDDDYIEVKIHDKVEKYICGDSVTKKEYATAKIYAETDKPVLILGETGTGKENLAHYIHAVSNRRNRKFYLSNSSHLNNKEIAATMLFGCKGGVHSTAPEDQKGFLEEADGGTIFFDEIASLDLDIQKKLLRFLEDKSFQRIGEFHIERKSNVRLIFATNEDISSTKLIRSDFLNRIAGFTLNLPPLRERRNDLIPLMDQFLLNANKNKPLRSRITDDGRDFLMSYEFPGNIRQLKTMIENAVVLSNEIDSELLNSIIKKSNYNMKSTAD